MGNLFAKPAKQNSRSKFVPSKQDQAILDLKLARDGLHRYQERAEMESERLLDRAKESHKAGNKKKAVYFMKVRKLKQSKIEDLHGQLLTIENQVNSIEWQTQSVQIFAAMESANNALKALHEVLPLEKVEELMDDVADEIGYQREIDAALSNQQVSVNDEELNKELDSMALELEEQSIAKGDISYPIAPDTTPLVLPAVPTSIVSEEKKTAPHARPEIVPLPVSLS